MSEERLPPLIIGENRWVHTGYTPNGQPLRRLLRDGDDEDQFVAEHWLDDRLQ
jgi:hypothetical protein